MFTLLSFACYSLSFIVASERKGKDKETQDQLDGAIACLYGMGFGFLLIAVMQYLISLI